MDYQALAEMKNNALLVRLVALIISFSLGLASGVGEYREYTHSGRLSTAPLSASLSLRE